MKGWVFYLSLSLAVHAERLRTLGRRILGSVSWLLARIFLPAPTTVWGGALGGSAGSRFRTLLLARLVRSERALGVDLGRQARLVLRLGAPEIARRIAWDAFRRWKAARRATLPPLWE